MQFDWLNELCDSGEHEDRYDWLVRTRRQGIVDSLINLKVRSDWLNDHVISIR